MKVSVEIAPDWIFKAKRFSDAVGGLLLRAAIEFIQHNTSMIQQGLTALGTPQKPNSNQRRAKKLKERGHDIPLRWDDVLSDPSEWLINGVPAQQFAGSFGARLGRLGAARTVSRVSSPVQFIVVQVPVGRDAVVGELELLGYAVPFSMTPQVEATIASVGEAMLTSGWEDEPPSSGLIPSRFFSRGYRLVGHSQDVGAYDVTYFGARFVAGEEF